MQETSVEELTKDFNKLKLDGIHKGDVKEFYEIKESLGSGQFSIVKLASEKETGQVVAIKTVKKDDIKDNFWLIKNEIEILRKVRHPNIVAIYDVYEDKDSFHIILESVLGGDLFDSVFKSGYFPEKLTRKLISQLLDVLSFLHDKNIIHADIKPENILMTEDKQIKLADFGFAVELQDAELDKSGIKRGTPQYVAPEVLKGKPYGKPVDMFSTGVLTYVLLSGREPFKDEAANKEAKYTFDVDEIPAWYDVSQYAIDFINKCLDENPSTRMTVQQALNHPWIAQSRSSLFSQDYLEKLMWSFLDSLLAVYKETPGLFKYWTTKTSSLFSRIRLSKIG